MSFSEPFCGCFSDLFSCVLVGLCPAGSCVVQASTIEKLTGQPFLNAFLLACLTCCFGQAYNRGLIKQTMGINKSYCEDCLLYFFCGGCASTQEYREVEYRVNSTI